jgi:hypothetical protein
MSNPELLFDVPAGCSAIGFVETSDKHIGGANRRLTMITRALCAQRIGPFVHHQVYEQGTEPNSELLLSQAQAELGRVVALKCLGCPRQPKSA